MIPLTRQRGDDVTEAIRTELRRIGFRGDRVVVRYFERSRLAVARRTGTDRDAQSTLHDVEEHDSSVAIRAAHGIPDAHVTYAVELDLSGPRARIVFPDGPPVDYAERADPILESMDRTGVALAVYDPAALQRAPTTSGRGSTEFWFRRHPSEGLLFLLEAAPRTPRTTTAR